MKFGLFFCCTLCALCFTSCNKLETVKEKDEYGITTEYQKDPKTGLKEGFLKKYNEKGKLIEETQFKNDKRNGVTKIYDPNGLLMQELTMVNGEEDGLFKDYFPGSNIVMRSGVFSKGNMQGEWKFNYPSGKLKQVVTFVNNIEDGPFKEYYESGVLKAEGQYKIGTNRFGISNEGTENMEHGELKEYNPDGSLNTIKDCEYGVCFTRKQAGQ